MKVGRVGENHDLCSKSWKHKTDTVATITKAIISHEHTLNNMNPSAIFEQDIATLATNQIEFYYSKYNTTQVLRTSWYQSHQHTNATVIMLGRSSKVMALVFSDAATLGNYYKLMQDKSPRYTFDTLTLAHDNQVTLLYKLEMHQIDTLQWLNLKHHDNLFDLSIQVLYENQRAMGPSYRVQDGIVTQAHLTNTTIQPLPPCIIMELKRLDTTTMIFQSSLTQTAELTSSNPNIRLAAIHDNDNTRPINPFWQYLLSESTLTYDLDYDATCLDHHDTFRFNNAVFNLNTNKIRDYEPDELVQFPDKIPTSAKEVQQLIIDLKQTSGTSFARLNTIILQHAKDQVELIITAIIPDHNQRTRLLHMLSQSLANKGDQRYIHVWTGADDIGKATLLKFIKRSIGNYCNYMDVDGLLTTKIPKARESNHISLHKQCRVVVINQPSEDIILKPTKIKYLFHHPSLENAKFNVIIPTRHNIAVDTSRTNTLSIPTCDVLRFQSFDVVHDNPTQVSIGITTELSLGFFHLLLDHYNMPSDFIPMYDPIATTSISYDIDTFLTRHCIIDSQHMTTLADLYERYKNANPNPAKSSIFAQVLNSKKFKVTSTRQRDVNGDVTQKKYWKGIGLVNH